MSEEILKLTDELVQLITRHISKDGVFSTAIPSLALVRRSHVSDRIFRVYNPSLCFIAQGLKEVFLGQERYEYGPADYLISSMQLPVVGQIITSSPDAPFLSIKLNFTKEQIFEVLNSSEIQLNKQDDVRRALFVGQIEISILDSIVRLVRLLDTPDDIAYLAPFYTKEILYRVLQGKYGSALANIALEESSIFQIRQVIEHIMSHSNKSLRIEKLAEIANMSISSFYRNFKEVTAMSPIQFQKQLRLQEARSLLISESADASDVAFRVGYESISQFSREYARTFGYPPKTDVKRLKELYDQRTNI